MKLVGLLACVEDFGLAHGRKKTGWDVEIQRPVNEVSLCDSKSQGNGSE